MAKKSMILKQQRPAKFSTRRYNRCKICGRPHAYLRDYGICVSASVSWLIRARSGRQKGFLVISAIHRGASVAVYQYSFPPRTSSDESFPKKQASW